ncbi:MAG: glycosyltransferase [Vicinamibacterales bacterium]
MTDPATTTRTTRRLRVVFLPHWHDNPYQHLLADGLGRLGADVTHVERRLWFLPALWRDGRPDVVHLHAPDHFVVYERSGVRAALALGVLMFQLAALRALGIRVAWTAHDLTNHERRFQTLDRWCRRATARLAHVVIVHCVEARRLVASALGLDEARLVVVPHGSYIGCYPEFMDGRDAARQALRLPADPLVVLFLGNLRRHKGVDALLDVFDRIERPGVRLVIAGQPFDEGIAAELSARAAGRVSVDYRPGVVPDAELGTYFAAADLVACPFASSLTSGSLALALSFGKPIVAPRLGCAVEMATEAAGFLYDAGAPDGLLSALRTAIDSAQVLPAIGVANRERMRQLDWTALAARTVEAYGVSNG